MTSGINSRSWESTHDLFNNKNFEHVVDELWKLAEDKSDADHTVAFVGRSGSGKSTLLCALLGYPLLPKSGSVSIIMIFEIPVSS
jgi:ABC-type bacteriocin/lantibiotic exporter with double-glycine peptidase domain